MPGERWQRVDELFNSVRDMPPDSRAAFLRNACDGDRDLHDEVSALIAAWENSDGFLADSALDVFARQVSIEGWTVRSGDRVDSYVIDRRIGAGGMGEVWRARDDRLDRFVALKLLLPRDGDGHARVRILADEARTAGSLNHPNILTVHDVGTHRGMPYLVTELLEGASLRARLARGPMALDDALAVALQIARGLRAAHARGIVHRDLKPENIFLTIDGIVKIVDFGLATLQRPDDSGSASEPIAGGTRGYMAPEQRRLGSVGAAADVYALGVILHEMLAGSRPARQEDAQVPRRGDRRISQRAARLIHRCTAESAQTRPSAADIVTELESIAAARERRIRTLARRPAVMVTAAAVLIVAGALAWRWSRTSAREEWARRIAAPQIEQLTAQGDFTAAYLLARRALAALPDDPHLQQLWLDTTVPVSVDTDPDGADVSIASYRNPGEWIWLGRSPLKDARMPRTVVRTRITKHGFADVEGSMQPPGARYELEPVAVVPAGMVRIVGDQDSLRPGLIGSLADFWISRFEVTNREFTRFVEAGGYTRREYWREPLVDQGRLLAWTAAIARFRDRTGQFGPANWRGGTYPEGQADYPVVGVSWYEAAAYATFAGKSLPTIHHWKAAASPGRFADVLVASNFSGKGPAAVGAYRGVGPFGTYDMAGNVKEWCSTAAADGRHFVLGGAWNEPRYMFDDFDARAPFYRGENIGFRVAQYDAPLPHAETAAVHLETLGGDLRTHAPVPDEIFDVYRREYAYDPRPLNASIEATIHRPLWDRDTVAFDAAYGAGERVRAYLFLPKNMTPPFQTVVIFPSSDSKRLASSGDMSLAAVDLAMSTGRAVLYPVYKGTYERAVPDVEGPAAARDLRIAWSRDLGRSIDYLSTRREIDSTRIAFYGTSLGGDAGIVLVPLEPRFKAAILQGSGLNRAAAPDIDPINFAPRLHVPVLMLNGRYDFERPLETSQTPLFQLIGSVEKKHAVFESGHSLATGDVASAVREWLDRYLGPPRR